MSSDIGSRLPPPVTAWPSPDSRPARVVEMTMVTGKPLWLPNCPDAKVHFTTRGLHLSHTLTDTDRDNLAGRHT